MDARVKPAHDEAESRQTGRTIVLWPAKSLNNPLFFDDF
jgi:hypothetical protein